MNPLSDPLSPEVESRPGLLRALGLGTAMAMVVGGVIGSGIFLKPGTIAADVGAFPLILTTWFAGGAVCIVGALCIAELAAMLPRAGGLYVYLREAYGRPVAFLFGWTEFLFGRTGTTGALAVAFVVALDAATPGAFSPTLRVVLASLLVFAVAGINVLGVIWGGRMQVATTVVKAGFLVVIALLPFGMLALGSPGFDAANYATTASPQEVTLSGQWAAAMLAVMWAYHGWHGIAPIAEEIRHPGRNIPLALLGGIGLLIALYVGVNLAYHGVLSMAEMAGSGQNVAQTTIQKLLAPWGTAAARGGTIAISAVIMCSTLGAINSGLLEGSRIAFAMGRDDTFFRSLGRVHVHYRTPVVSLVVMAVMSAGLIVGAAVAVETVPRLKGRDVFGMLTDFVVFSASLFYMLAVLAVIVLRWRHPEWERPFRTPASPLVPLAYLGFYGWFLYAVYTASDGSRYAANTGLQLVALGIPVYLVWRVWAARHPQDVPEEV